MLVISTETTVKIVEVATLLKSGPDEAALRLQRRPVVGERAAREQRHASPGRNPPPAASNR